MESKANCPPPPPEERQAIRDHLQPSCIVRSDRQVQIPDQEVCRDPGPGKTSQRRSPRRNPDSPTLLLSNTLHGRGHEDRLASHTGRCEKREGRGRWRTRHQTWDRIVTVKVLDRSVPNVPTHCRLGSGVRRSVLRRAANHRNDRRDPARRGQVGLAGTHPPNQSTPGKRNHWTGSERKTTKTEGASGGKSERDQWRWEATRISGHRTRNERNRTQEGKIRRYSRWGNKHECGCSDKRRSNDRNWREATEASATQSAAASNESTNKREAEATEGTAATAGKTETTEASAVHAAAALKFAKRW